MRKRAVLLLLNIFCVLACQSVQGHTGIQSRPKTIDRDIRLERAISARYQRIMKLLQPEAKRKLAIASRALLKEVVKSPQPANLEERAGAEVQKEFARISRAQIQLLSFYALADVAQYATKSLDGVNIKANLETKIENQKSDLDSMSEMGEMESLRLQMAMDRMSKMMTTLSNLLKKISDTSDGIINNIK